MLEVSRGLRAHATASWKTIPIRSFVKQGKKTVIVGCKEKPTELVFSSPDGFLVVRPHVLNRWEDGNGGDNTFWGDRPPASPAAGPPRKCCLLHCRPPRG